MADECLQDDLGQFFDFGEASIPEFHDIEADRLNANRNACPSHPNDDCLCHGFMTDFDINDPILAAATTDGFNGFNDDFSTWVPRYRKPEHPCDYCKSKQLDCFFIYEGQESCSACSNLFRQCSFTQPKDHERPKNAIDTLHAVLEDTLIPNGSLTGIKTLRSRGGHHSRISHDDDGDRSTRKSGTRFSRGALKVLKDWLDEHADNPYPTEAEKEDLTSKTGLSNRQVSNWLANARRRGKVRQSPRIPASPTCRPSTASIPISQDKAWEDMTPMDRWKHSPPEHEPAPITLIAQAADRLTMPEPPDSAEGPSDVCGVSRSGRSSGWNSSGGGFKAPSTASFETGLSGFSGISSGSANSFGSAWSYDSRPSLGSFGSNPKKERRRRRRPAPRPSRQDTGSKDRVFQCTFCTDTFKHKYDWSRHEKSLHLSLEKWICAPLGEVITCSASGEKKCVYCDAINPSPEHLETHNHSTCGEKGLAARTFYRKDHLRQHLRLMHNCKMIESMNSWKSELALVRSRCGFCGETFVKWQDRVDHLAKEFRKGAQMKDWKGCRGFDPEIAAQVTYAMPPYLIGNEAKSPFPFSASNTASLGYHQQHKTDLEAVLPPLDAFNMDWTQGSLQTPSSGVGSGSVLSTLPSPIDPSAIATPSSNLGGHVLPRMSTCWEILTLRLGRYVKQQVELGIPVTDAMLQSQARKLLYGEDDSWNQTAADNPEWLGLFKKAHGLEETIAPQEERLNAMEDLGMIGQLKFDPLFEKKWDLIPIPDLPCINGTMDSTSRPSALSVGLHGGKLTTSATSTEAAMADPLWDLSTDLDFATQSIGITGATDIENFLA